MSLPFLSKRAGRREEIVAIDLGGRHTKAVHVQMKGERLNLLSYTIQDSPSEQSSFSVDVMAEHLKAVTQALGGGTKAVVISLGVGDTVVRRAEMPPMPISDMRQLLKFNTKNYLQQDLPDHVFDCSFVIPRAPTAGAAEVPKPAGPQKQKLIVGAAKRQIVDDVAAAARGAGLSVAQVVPGMVGPLNAFEVAEPESFARDAVAIVDIGFRHTTISVLQQGELIMHRVINMGGDRITQGLSETMGIGYAEAEGIKVGMASEVQAALEPLVAGLGRELRAFLDFFEHQQDVPVSQIFLTGGSARGDLLVQALQMELLVPCRILNPTGTFHLALSPEQAMEFSQLAPQMAAAVGAAISAV